MTTGQGKETDSASFSPIVFRFVPDYEGTGEQLNTTGECIYLHSAPAVSNAFESERGQFAGLPKTNRSRLYSNAFAGIHVGETEQFINAI